MMTKRTTYAFEPPISYEEGRRWRGEDIRDALLQCAYEVVEEIYINGAGALTITTAEEND